MTFTEAADLFPGAHVHMYALGFQVVGYDWTIKPPASESEGHTLTRAGAESVGTLAELHAILFPQDEDAAREPSSSEPPPRSLPKSPTATIEEGGADELAQLFDEEFRETAGTVGAFSYQPDMSNEDYHAHKAWGSTGIKPALIHPALAGKPSTINPKTAALGNQMHCAVIEPEEVFNRYTVRPDPSDHPEALVGADGKQTNKTLTDALKDAGVAGYSGKKRVELEEMCREFLPSRRIWTDILSEHGKAAGGKAFVSAAELEAMERVAEAVMSHDEINGEGIFSKGEGESSFFAPIKFDSFDLFGEVFEAKCRPDWLQWNLVPDLKTSSAGSLEAFYKQADNLNYDLSAALYLKVLDEHARNPDDAFAWVVIDMLTIEDGRPVEIHIADLSPAFLARGRDKLEEAFQRISLWKRAPELYQQQHCPQVRHIAEPPAWDWRKRS